MRHKNQREKEKQMPSGVERPDPRAGALVGEGPLLNADNPALASFDGYRILRRNLPLKSIASQVIDN
jgi:hypothetical protein